MNLFYLERYWEVVGGGGADEILAGPELDADLDVEET